MSRFLVQAIAIIFCQSLLAGYGYGRMVQLEKQVLDYLASRANESLLKSQRCDDSEGYLVYIIDNFDEKITIVPEIEISHGEMVRKLLLSGREDFQVTVKNTSLSRGLAAVLTDLKGGGCVDAVLSSIPGSNYSYQQVSSLLEGDVLLSPANILDHKERLLKLLQRIAYGGFPSVDWLKKSDVNQAKLREDARKIAFIEALGQLHIPVYLPYGNADGYHRGEQREINLLSLANNAKVYSAVDHEGKRLKDFPYSPLSSGNAQATFVIVECPAYDDAQLTFVDINEDGYSDFSYMRNDFIPYYDENANLSYAPPLTESEVLDELEKSLVGPDGSFNERSLVLTREKYDELRGLCSNCSGVYSLNIDKSLVWLNSERYGPVFSFNPQCRQRGLIAGTSLIPPMKVQELLAPRGTSTTAP